MNPVTFRYFEGRIFQTVWSLKVKGYAERTLEGIDKRLRMFSRNVNLDDPEQVKRFIAEKDCGNAYKESLVNAYIHYARAFKLSWSIPKYKRDERLPNVPTTEQVNRIIAHSRRKYALVFSILRDTGLRPVELERLTLKQVDLEKGVIYPRTAKGGRARALKLKTATLAILKDYVTKNDFKITERMFPSTALMSHIWRRIRNRLAKRSHEPQLMKFRLYDLRHYFATMLYHQTKDILLVKEKLGHRRLENTLIYTHLVDFREEDYICRAAQNIKEASTLIESGFEYVTEIDGNKLFRKRK